MKYLVFCISLLLVNEDLYSAAKQSQQSSSSQQTLEKDDAFDNFPFIKSQSSIAKDHVAGIRIKNGSIVFLGHEKTFSVESFKEEDENFSNSNFFRKYPKLFSVELNGIKLSNQALENLQKFLPRDLKNFIIDSCTLEKDGAELIADIIRKHNKSIKAITIKHVKGTSEEASKIAAAISTLSGLDYLSVTFKEVNQDACDHIASAIEHSNGLKTLAISWEKTADKEEQVYEKLSEEISKLHKLTSLEVSIISISEKCTDLIINAMSHLNALTKLRLYFGNLSFQNHIKLFETAEVLGDAIKQLTNLKSLNLSHILLPKDAMQVVAQAIGSLKDLEDLNLSGNIIDKETGSLLAESFKETSALKTLSVRNCEIDSQTFSEFAKSLSSLSIVTLFAGNNQIKDGIKSLPIKSMQDLQFVDFTNNDVTFDALMGLLPETIGHDKLKAIDFKNNKALYAIDDKDGDINTKRDKIETWKLKNRSKFAVFGI